MADQTQLGYPYPENSDNVNVAGDISSLAYAVDESPGVTPLTATEIDALTELEAREGRLVYNLTEETLWQRVNGAWAVVVDESTTQELLNKTLSGQANTFSDIPAEAVTGTAVVQADLDTHTSATTSVHGITDTSTLETVTGAQAKADAAQAAAQSYADTAVANLVDSAPPLLDTLNELAAAIGDDENYATTVANTIATAVTNLEAYADQAEADAVSAAALDATAKADAALSGATSYTDTEVATAVSSLEAYADQAEADAVSTANTYTDTSSAAVALSASTDLTSHTSATTSVHGIADTSALITTDDARLSDSRTPTVHASSHATGGVDALTPADIGAAEATHTHDYADTSHTHAGFVTSPSTPGSGDLLVGDGAGGFDLVALGPDGYVLTSGAGTAAWAEPVGGSGGGAALSDATPEPLGTASAGVSATASRSDHVHQEPAAPFGGIDFAIGGTEPTSAAGYLWVDTAVEV